MFLYFDTFTRLSTWNLGSLSLFSTSKSICVVDLTQKVSFWLLMIWIVIVIFNYKGGQKRIHSLNLFWTDQNHTKFYKYILRYIYVNYYSLKFRPKWVNTFIHDFMRTFLTLFNKGFFQWIEIVYPFALVYILLQESPNPKIYWIQICTSWWSVLGIQ